MTQNEILAAVKSTYAAVGSNADDDARAMGLAKGMTLHPVVTDELEEREINGKKEKCFKCIKDRTVEGRTFQYFDTVEGPILAVAQLTRMGNGLPYTGNQGARLAGFMEDFIGKPQQTITVTNLYTRDMAGGGVSRSGVFRINK